MLSLYYLKYVILICCILTFLVRHDECYDCVSDDLFSSCKQQRALDNGHFRQGFDILLELGKRRLFTGSFFSQIVPFCRARRF